MRITQDRKECLCSESEFIRLHFSLKESNRCSDAKTTFTQISKLSISAIIEAFNHMYLVEEVVFTVFFAYSLYSARYMIYWDDLKVKI